MTDISKERLEEMLQSAIDSVQEYMMGEYSSHEEFRPAGMTAREYDQVMGRNRLEELREKIKFYEDRLQKQKVQERRNQHQIDQTQKNINALQSKLTELKKDY